MKFKVGQLVIAHPNGVWRAEPDVAWLGRITRIRGDGINPDLSSLCEYSVEVIKHISGRDVSNGYGQIYRMCGERLEHYLPLSSEADKVFGDNITGI